VTEPTSSDEIHSDDTVDNERPDEDRAISDVGLPHPGDDARVDAVPAADDAALDEVFPPEDR
jgi:hypothetical protein